VKSAFRCLAATTLTCLAAVAPAAEGASAPLYKQASGSSLTITFTQLGSATQGSCGRFTTERDGVLVTPELFDAQKFPVATFEATSLVRGASGLEAPGKLTIRGVTRDLRLPLAVKSTEAGLELTGATSFKRLDFGVGQGDWQSTESVGDEVKVQYKVLMTRSP
jgi:polyisoprenoid-binding protein YceI